MKKIIIAVLALALVITLALFAGADGFGVPAPDIFWLLRVPRVWLGLIAGAALAAGGVTCQALLRNPLADPYVLGLSGGAALGAVLAQVLLASLGLPLWIVLAAAWGGAWLASLLVFAAPGTRDVSVGALLLSGVVFNAFAAAVITLVKTLVSATKAQEVLFWLMGQLSMYDKTYIAWLALAVLFGLALLFWHARALDLLVQGDDVAQSLGVDLVKVRRQLYFALTLLVGSVVAATGLIGFVGLVVPHLLRGRTVRHRQLLILSALWGGVLVVGADAICRAAFAWVATELPVGVLTAFIGAPFFMVTLRRKKSELI